MVAHGAHADDLPPGDAGLPEIRRRVIQYYHEHYEYPIDELEKLRFREADASAVVEGPLPLM